MSTQHTDRELLELAARAYGLGDDWAYCAEHDAMCQYDSGVNKFWGYARWNPRDDDGDALRLTVKLRIDIEWDEQPAGRTVEAYQRGEESCFCATEAEADYRRAIVRAAAAIGAAKEGASHAR